MKLNEKYNQDSFIDFIDTFLPEDFKSKEEDIIIKKDRYKEITKAKILGFCESLDLHVFEMDHTHDKDPRVAIATDAFKILADHWIHRALVIFKNNDSENYRLSYLTITLDLNDKNKVIKKYSNARRYSFYLGANAKVKTPEQQLIKKGKVKDIDDLLSRFSVEVVNKQFYLEVAKFFDELVSTEVHNLVLPSVSESDLNIRKSFAVRLIGRMMFCWFLKQKKSDNGQLIPDELLSSKIVSDNYYHNILEPLFFGVLNTSIDSRDIRSELFDKVPYLNGGLFNPQTDDYYEMDRGTFTSKFINTLKISDKWFKEFFELLETYNFTIDENTVFDQELSVDPEMLGRIFENLLAEINPETGSSERKRTGSFYTPRQIVEYMVDQSLIEYFKTKTSIDINKLSAVVSYDLTDDIEHPLSDIEKQELINAIESLKILDPACGSGAYPIGALQKIVYILQQIDPDCTLWLEKKLQGVPDLYKQKIINEVKQNPFDYTRKLDVIKNSIFGVDIQPVAVDVSRLRCFLTLVVESEIDDKRPNRGIEPLPNLDFKFVCANTLISLPKSENTGLFDDHSGITELSKIMSEYFSCNSQRKTEIKLKFSNAQKYILEKTIQAFGRNTGELTLKLTTWNPFSNHSNSWFDAEWMFGLQEKFDVVIGNPPYIKEHTSREAFDGVRESIYYQGKMDLWYMFACMLFDVLKQDTGILTFIATNNWVTNAGASKFRNKITKDSKMLSLIDFGDYKIFESAGIQTMILVAQRSSSEEEYKFDYRKIVGTEYYPDMIGKILNKTPDANFQYLQPKFKRIDYLNKTFVFTNDSNSSVLDKIYKKGNFYIDGDKELMSGIDVLQDFVNKNSLLKLGAGFNVGDGIFVLSNDEKLRLSLSIKENSIIKPYFTTKELGSYYGNKENVYWIIYTDSSFKDPKKIEDYPNIKNHLDKFKDVITSENGTYGLNRPREERFFKDEKIMSLRKCGIPTFTYTDFDCYVSRAFFSIKTDRINQKYLTGILNSKVIVFWLKNKGKMQGNNFQVDKDPLISLPIYKPTNNEQLPIIRLVDDILISREVNPKNDILIHQSQIDELVMDLYSLTNEEKEIIRNS